MRDLCVLRLTKEDPLARLMFGAQPRRVVGRSA